LPELREERRKVRSLLGRCMFSRQHNNVRLHFVLTANLPSANIVVVVVEDEPLIRMVLTEALLDDGFDVIEATHAREAITVLEFEAARVHALFADVHMPGDLDGVGLAHHARVHWPWLSLLVTSGRAYPDSNAMPEGTRFVPKPYELSNVIRHIREMHAAI
jgi:CheY-like chemotaxis protein